MLVITFFLIFRSIGLFPSVFDDEYWYSTVSRLVPFHGAYPARAYPDYLYYDIYKLTNFCGSSFAECSKVLNVWFFVFATPFIYMVCRNAGCNSYLSIWISCLGVLSAVNTYTAYFMPESLYFFLFWTITWFVLRVQNLSASYFLTIGVCFGIISLVKPHALFLLPAMGVFFIFLVREKYKEDRLLTFLKSYTLFLVTAIATKLLLGLILAGPAGFTLFGAYKGQTPSIKGWEDYLSLLVLGSQSLLGHVLAVLLLFSVPVAQILISVRLWHGASIGNPAADLLIVYTTCIVTTLLAITALFTASITGAHLVDTIGRMHMRYYNFSLPLLIIVGALTAVIASRRIYRALAAVPIAAGIVYAVSTKFTGFSPNVVDSPELQGFIFNPTAFWLLSGLSLVALLSWVYDAQIGGKVFTFIFMPLTVAFTGFYANQLLRAHLVPDVYDRAGLFAKAYLSPEERSKLIIVGKDPGAISKAAYHVDALGASFVSVPNGDELDLDKISVGKEWVLLIGDYDLPQRDVFQITMRGYTLYRVAPPTAWHQGGLARVLARGWSEEEPWGVWTVGQRAQLSLPVFAGEYPSGARIELQLTGFAPLEPQQVTVVTPEVPPTQLRLGSQPQTVTIEVPSSALSAFKPLTIDFQIPNPVSPRSLGMSQDSRLLGVGLVGVRVTSQLENSPR